MSIRLSTAMRNAFAQGYGLKELLRDGRLFAYTGAQPATADAAPTGTLLCTYTLSGNAYTGATRADVELTLGGAAGTLDTVKVGGMAENLLAAPVPFNTSLTQTATDVAASINSKENSLNIVAVANTPANGDVMLYAPYWLGALANGLTIATTSTTLTVDIDNAASPGTAEAGVFAGGVTMLNGLNFAFPAVDGVLSKEATVWQGTAVASGTAGWFRFVAGGSTADGVAGADVRFDGTLATSGGDLTISSTSIAAGSIQTVSSLTLTIPAA